MSNKTGSRSGIRIRDDHLDHISESLETNFWVKILFLFDADSGWKKFGSGMENIRIRDKHIGYAKLKRYVIRYYGASKRIQLN